MNHLNHFFLVTDKQYMAHEMLELSVLNIYKVFKNRIEASSCKRESDKNYKRILNY